MLSLLAVLGIPLRAQGTSSLRGVVLDPQKASVVGAIVTLTDKDTGVVRATPTQDGGQYSFVQIKPGTYSIKVEAPGFGVQQLDGIKLLVDTPSTLDVDLLVATSSAQVNVTADVVQLNTVDASIGNAFEERQVGSLPIQTRNAAQLLGLQPGVTQNGEVMGARRDQNNITLDGVDVNDNQNALSGLNGNNISGGLPAPSSNPTTTTAAPTSGFNAALPVPLDSVQEFRVTVAGNGAGDGHSSGGQVALITRSGTNTLHGSAYEYNRNTAYTANNWFNNRSGLGRPQLIRNQFGASLGGPIKKDRIFFFMNYERRLDNSQQTQTRTVPSESLKQGIVTFQSAAGQTFTLNPAQIKAADPNGIGVNPAMLALLQSYPVGNAPALGADQGLNFSGYLFNAPVKLDYRTYVAKMDWIVDSAAKNTVSFRGTLSNQSQTNAAAEFSGQAPASQLLADNRGFGVRVTSLLAPTLTNTANIGLTRIGYGSTGSNANSLAFGDVSNLSNFVRGNSRINPTWNLTDDLNWVKGSHTISGGANFLVFSNTLTSYTNSFASYSFGRGSLVGLGADINQDVLNTIGQPNLALSNGQAVTNAMGDLLGILTGGTITYNYLKNGSSLPVGQPTNFDFHSQTYGFYVQDSWKVTPKLTVTYGLRYEYATPPYEANGLQVAPTEGLDQYFGARIAAMYAGIPGNQITASDHLTYNINGPANGDPTWYKPDKNNFAPKLSVAYAATNKTVIRMGASLAYDQFGNDLAAQVSTSGAAGLTSVVSFPTSYNFTTAPRYNGSVPALAAAPAGGFPFTPPDIHAIAGTSYGMSPNLVTPYAYLGNLSVSHQFGHGLTLDVGYIGRFSHRLLAEQSVTGMLLYYKDNKSGMTFQQADSILRGIYDSGVTPNQVKANPSLIPTNAFAEDMFPALQNYYFPGSASANYFYGIYGQYAGSDLDNLHALDRITSAAHPNCITVTGCYTFFAPQGSSNYVWFNSAAANYNALTVSLRRGLRNGLSFDFNYTWSHSIDNASTSASGAGVSGAQFTNPFIPSLSRGSSDFDLRHQINANFVYELPFGRNKMLLGNAPKWLDEIVGGWQISSIIHFQSGLPSTIGGTGAYSTNYSQSNQEVQKGAIAVPTGTVNYDQLGNPSLFTSTKMTSSYADYYPGGSPTRGLVRMPWQRNLDAAVSKNFPIPWEHQSLQLRAEAFNLFNFVNFTNVSLAVSSPGTFGEFTAAADARVLQLALRYSF